MSELCCVHFIITVIFLQYFVFWWWQAGRFKIIDLFLFFHFIFYCGIANDDIVYKFCFKFSFSLFWFVSIFFTKTCFLECWLLQLLGCQVAGRTFFVRRVLRGLRRQFVITKACCWWTQHYEMLTSPCLPPASVHTIWRKLHHMLHITSARCLLWRTGEVQYGLMFFYI